jgi:hypothetical protein
MEFMADHFNVRDAGIFDMFLEGHSLNVVPLKMREKPLKKALPKAMTLSKGPSEAVGDVILFGAEKFKDAFHFSPRKEKLGTHRTPPAPPSSNRLDRLFNILHGNR